MDPPKTFAGNGGIPFLFSFCLQKSREFDIVYIPYSGDYMEKCNVGQGIADAFSKLYKIVFSLKCFRIDFLQFSSAAVKIFICHLTLVPSNSGVFLTYPNFLRSQILRCWGTREATSIITLC